MELKIYLSGKKRKKNWIIGLGVYTSLFPVSQIIFSLVKKKPLYRSDWVFFGIWFLFGLIWLFIGFFGKAYILINSEIISLKTSVFDKKQFVNWNEIKSVNYNPINTEFKIEKTDGATQVINISNFDYALLLEIKKTVSCIAKEKNIQINI